MCHSLVIIIISVKKRNKFKIECHFFAVGMLGTYDGRLPLFIVSDKNLDVDCCDQINWAQLL